MSVRTLEKLEFTFLEHKLVAVGLHLERHAMVQLELAYEILNIRKTEN